MGIPIFSELIAVLVSHPLLAYLLVLFLLFTDSWIGSVAHFNGIVGTIINVVAERLTGHNLGITSFQILVVLVITPLALFALNNSRKSVKF